MRVLAIRGRNLASLEGDFEVDFTAEPLESAGIFAITGPTGAGKSTLLDAMCLALFNRLPRLVHAGKGEIGAEAGEAITASDPRAVLRHRTGEGHAEVDFIGRDRVRYRARWIVRRARGKVDGALQHIAQEFTNLDTGDRIGGTRTETLDAIRERVGLTAEQFSRAVMLAQGEFDAFVRADANDRAALLEKLTGTGIYAQLGIAAKRKADGLRADLVRIEQRIADQNGLDDVARGEAEGALAEAQGALDAADAVLAELERERLWHVRAEELAARITAAQEALDRAQAAQAEAEPHRNALRRRREAAAFVGEWRAVEQARAKVAGGVTQLATLETAAVDAQTEAARCAAVEQAAGEARETAHAALEAARPELERARALDRELEQARAQLAPLEAACAERTADFELAEADWQAALQRHGDGAAELAAHQAWLAENNARRALAVRQSGLLANLDEHAALTEQLNTLATEAGVAGEAIVRHTETHVAASEAARGAADALTDAEVRLARALAAAPSPDAIDAATRHRDALAAIEPRLATVEHQIARVAQLAGDLSRLADEGKREGEALTRDRAEWTQIDTALPPLRARLDEARRSSALSEAAADKAAARLRATLVPGEPCPVCGSSAHQQAVVGVLDERAASDLARVSELDADVRAKEQRVAVLTDRIAAAEVRVARLQAQTGHAEAALVEAQTAEAGARVTLTKAATAVALDAADLTQLRATLTDRLAQADRQRAEFADAQQAVEIARANAEAGRTKRDDADAALRLASDAKRDAVAGKAELDRRLTDLTDRHQRLYATLDADLAPHFAWAEALDPRATLTDLAEQWVTHESEAKALAAALPGLAQALHAADLKRAAASIERDAAQANVARLTERHGQLESDRAALFAGEATTSVATRLEDALRTAATGEQEARDAAGAARTALVGATAALTARRETHAADETDATKRSSALTARLDAMSLSLDAVAAEAEAATDALETEQAALDGLAEAVTRAEAAHAARLSDQAGHLASDAPERTLEALVPAIADATSTQAAARDAHTHAALVIRQDDAARDATAALRADHAALQGNARVWLQLDQLIGDATGNKFRRFAQGLTLDRLLLHANARLAELKPRYELQRGAGGDMLVQVIDHDMAGEVRGLHNLSGGERFLVSLALALGLSEMSTGEGLRIESLFIDEGFGALDSASLGAAIAMLEQLHATGRRVGVISHIEEVKERISVKIAVTPVARGRSVVEVVAE